ncbi:MAG: glycosyltransferase [Bacteroidales bacterium]|jgi:glycosyltransferase involved in cell wall biosynthesis|nr:glycosyltransferase [Bacteroidales bacterium]
MSGQIMISVITPSFNQEVFIRRTIMSVVDQQVDFPVEYIIIDGGSTDKTLGILEQYSGRLRWISEKDSGQSDALNKGISLATGEIIGWLNSDDLYLPGALQKVKNYFDANPGCQWAYGKCRIVDEQDSEIRRWLTNYKNFFLKYFNYNALLLENFISQPAVFFKKSAFEDAGLLALNLPYALDYDLWIRLAKKTKPGYIDDYLACFRVHQEAKSRLYSKKQFREQYNIHKKYDKRVILLVLHRINMIRTIAGYWTIEQINYYKKKWKKTGGQI